MKTGISYEKLKSLVQCEDVSELKADELISLFSSDKKMSSYLPEVDAVKDPRTENYIIFNAKRASRPKDNLKNDSVKQKECLICSGDTTGVIDLKEISSGYTFINKNLFPILYPHENPVPDVSSSGFHFLQWTSSNHNDSWINMDIQDLSVVFSRTAAIEKWLIDNSRRFFPVTGKGWVTLIKNFGKAVGGSLEHDHQQIGFSSVMPGQVKRNLVFMKKNNIKYSAYLDKENPGNLTVFDYGTVKLVVPFFMQRPLYMTLYLKDFTKDYLYQLDLQEITDISQAWSDAVYAIHKLMISMGREPAFNIISNTGTGVFFDFLPFTQEFGGFEHSGLFLCQMTPLQACSLLKEEINNRRVQTS